MRRCADRYTRHSVIECRTLPHRSECTKKSCAVGRDALDRPHSVIGFECAALERNAINEIRAARCTGVFASRTVRQQASHILLAEIIGLWCRTKVPTTLAAVRLRSSGFRLPRQRYNPDHRRKCHLQESLPHHDIPPIRVSTPSLEPLAYDKRLRLSR